MRHAAIFPTLAVLALGLTACGGTAESTPEANACTAETPETALAETITAAPIPENVTAFAVQEVAPNADHDDQDDVNVVVRLCSAPLDADQHRTIATDIAVHVKGHEDAGAINELRVQSWTPDGDELAQERTLMVDDYQSYTWDQESAAVDISNVWGEPNA